jgi:Glycosyl hydrolase family 26
MKHRRMLTWIAAALLLVLAPIHSQARDATACQRAKKPRHCAAGGARRAVLARPAAVAVSTSAQRPMLWGAQIGTQLTGTQAPWDMTPVTDFQAEAGKAPSIVPFNLPFVECGSSCYGLSFPTTLLTTIRGYGAIPMINWSAISAPVTGSEPQFSLQHLIAGDYDTYIRGFAEGARAWGSPLFLRFDWEMNGNWFPWGADTNGNTAGQYVAAWRHVHDIFTAAGATNVNWVWCPYVTVPNATADLRALYPGDAYVDWTGLDAYNWGTTLHGPHGWISFRDTIGATYAKITQQIAPGKPMMLGEVASSSHGGSRPRWIADMFSSLRTTYTAIDAVVWMDAPDGATDWTIDHSGPDLAAFRSAVDRPTYQSNAFGALGAGSISTALAQAQK